eukprot:TRINITY_DN7243_c1_g1_i1.p1 TRINITY_DN7243_c1_g1~~TRINITY_DN7243_c1_g1_i1.p1  ORF type:complete len:328 (+),score=34.77 TRINITY_DN7243_c1_g1_i1:67-1050(+)
MAKSGACSAVCGFFAGIIMSALTLAIFAMTSFDIPLSITTGVQNTKLDAARARAESCTSRYAFDGGSDLQKHFTDLKGKEGPGLWKWVHYFDIYDKHFARFRGTDVHFMEIGIFSGGSLRMWREYFGPKARICGVDISNRTLVYEDNAEYGYPTKIFIGDQGDAQFWDKTLQILPRLDILVDDGGHHAFQQQMTHDKVMPFLAPGGVMLVEDAHGGNHLFLEGMFDHYIRSEKGLNAYRFFTETGTGMQDKGSKPMSEIQKTFVEVSFYTYMVVIEKLKKRRDGTRLWSPMHGSIWQPPTFWEDTYRAAGSRIAQTSSKDRKKSGSR